MLSSKLYCYITPAGNVKEVPPPNYATVGVVAQYQPARMKIYRAIPVCVPRNIAFRNLYRPVVIIVRL